MIALALIYLYFCLFVSNACHQMNTKEMACSNSSPAIAPPGTHDRARGPNSSQRVKPLNTGKTRGSVVAAAAVEETVEGCYAEARSFRPHRRDGGPLVVQGVVALPRSEVCGPVVAADCIEDRANCCHCCSASSHLQWNYIRSLKGRSRECVG